MSYFTYSDLISSLLDVRLVDRGSSLIYVTACILVFCKKNRWSALFSQLKKNCAVNITNRMNLNQI